MKTFFQDAGGGGGSTGGFWNSVANFFGYVDKAVPEGRVIVGTAITAGMPGWIEVGAGGTTGSLTAGGGLTAAAAGGGLTVITSGSAAVASTVWITDVLPVTASVTTGTTAMPQPQLAPMIGTTFDPSTIDLPNQVDMAKKPDLKLIDWIAGKNSLTPGQREVLHDEMQGLKSGPADSVDPKIIDDLAKQIRNDYPDKK